MLVASAAAEGGALLLVRLEVLVGGESRRLVPGAPLLLLLRSKVRGVVSVWLRGVRPRLRAARRIVPGLFRAHHFLHFARRAIQAHLALTCRCRRGRH